jgi:hypothetical protein
MKTGWEIKPLGWIALIMLAGAAIYFVFFRDKAKERLAELREKTYVDNS